MRTSASHSLQSDVSIFSRGIFTIIINFFNNFLLYYMLYCSVINITFIKIYKCVHSTSANFSLKRFHFNYLRIQTCSIQSWSQMWMKYTKCKYLVYKNCGNKLTTFSRHIYKLLKCMYQCTLPLLKMFSSNISILNVCYIKRHCEKPNKLKLIA